MRNHLRSPSNIRALIEFNRGGRSQWLQNLRIAGWLLLVLLSMGECRFCLAQELEVQAETGVKVKMRDEVTLVADIYRPKAQGKYPVILERTPYDRKADLWKVRRMASHGYVVIFQDTRGRYDSEGQFYPFKYESQDGYDTVEWAANLDFSNGKVGMNGGSYVGATQLLAAMAKPPHLVAILPILTASEYYDGWTYENGALMQWFAGTWASFLSLDTIRKLAIGRAQMRAWTEELPVESYPLVKLPAAMDYAPYFRDWVLHEREDEYWRQWKVSDHYSEISVKGLHVGGWHDIFVKGSIRNFMGLRASGPTPEVREGQKMIIGPWAHAPTSPEGKIGDVIFGKEAMQDWGDIALEWADYILKGVQNRFASTAPVRIFVMGENKWRDEQEFPLARARSTKYYLRTPEARAARGNLSLEPPKDEAPREYLYDPAQPVPTLGGRLCCSVEIPAGPFDLRPYESRSDVLVYSTPPLEKDIEATGFITLELYAKSTGLDTDFTAWLADVEPNGYARYLVDGIVRGRYRNSTEKAELLTPGEIYKYTIDLWATSNLFRKGHQIQVYLSSSNFPRFNRNLNTGEMTLGSVRMSKALQTVYSDRKHPSALILPVVPR